MSRSLRPLLAIVIAVAACGGGPAGGSPDAGGPDANLDPGGTVSVTVYGNDIPSVPTAGIPVVFAQPDGSVSSIETSDASGRAQGKVRAGGSVTTVLIGGGPDFMQTILGVAPGDDLTIGSKYTEPTLLGSFTVTGTATSGASQYYAYSPCGSNYASTATVTLNVWDSCATAPVEIALVAIDGGGKPLGYVTATGVSMTAGGGTTMPSVWQPPATVAASYSGIDPAQIARIEAVRRTKASLFYGGGADVSGATAAFDVPSFAAPDATLTTTFIATGNGEKQIDVAPIAGADLTYSRDVGTGLLPWVDAATLDPATATIHVQTHGAAATDVDLEYSLVTYSRGSQHMMWVAIGPGAGDVKLPTLTGALAVDNPAVGDTIDPARLSLIAADSVTSYGAIRNQAFATYDRVTGDAVDEHVRRSLAP